MSILPGNFVIFLALAALLAALIFIPLYIRELFLKRHLIKKEREEYEQFKQKTASLLAAAEAAHTQILGGQSLVAKKAEEQFRNQLVSLLEFSQKSLSSSTEELEKFLKELKQSGLRFEESSRKAAEARINQLFGNLEERLSEFLISTEQQTTQSIELEVKAARNLIESYKQQQLKLIDENIIAMMEQTLSIILGKKLDLKEHLDLVYEALEKAKVDKFVV